MAKNKIIAVLLLISLNSFAQQKVKFPVPIFPQQQVKIFSDTANKRFLKIDNKTYSLKSDTLWLITHKQIKKTIETAKENQILKQQKQLYQQIIDSLKQEISLQQQLIDTIKKDRDFYIDLYHQTENDVSECQKNTKRQATYFRIAIISGAALSVAMFFLGAYLFH